MTQCNEEMLAAASGAEYDHTLLLYGTPTLLNRDLSAGLAALEQQLNGIEKSSP